MTPESLAILYGLSAAAIWGTGDFAGGLATRRTEVTGVVLVSHILGLVLYLSLALISQEAIPDIRDLLYGAAAGLAGMFGLLALYKGLAEGRMGVTAPVAAVVTAILPMLVGFAMEGLPGSVQLFGFGMGLLAVWFLSSEGSGGKIRWQLLTLPVLAGIGFALFLILIDRVTPGAFYWPLTAARVASVVFLLLILKARPQSKLPILAALPFVIISGLFDAGGNAFAMLAAQTGRLDIASILSAMYPVSTVLLAWLFLGERLSVSQRWGAGLALMAVVLITL